jgi:zinc transport system substrate-binding protein
MEVFMRNIFFAILVILFFWGCGPAEKDTGNIEKSGREKIRVTVSILPQQYFVRRIAADKAVINVMIPPGHSPATYEPTPQQVKELSGSRIYFRIGHIAFEKAWMGHIEAANPGMKIVDTSKGVQLLRIDPGHAAGHHAEEVSPGEAARDHEHTGVDPHIWLSPEAVKVQAKNILDCFLEFDPENRNFYEEQCAAFCADINRLNEELHAVVKNLRGKKIMVFHPAWGYLARDLGLLQIPIEVEGKEPNPADLKRVIDIAGAEGIRVIFVQRQFATHTAEAIAREIDGKVVVLDPLAPDWLNNMKKIGEILKATL